MSAPQWRRVLLLAFCVLCTAINARSIFTNDVEASSALGFQVDRTQTPSTVVVTSVDSGGGAAASGLRAGDLIHLNALSPGDRYRLLIGVHEHERIPIVITRAGRTSRMTFTGGAPAWRWDTWLWCIASFWLLGFATFLAWKKADSTEARVLCTLLLLFVAGSGLAPGSWLTPWPFADMLSAIVACALLMASGALLATYASLFARPLSFSRRALTALTYGTAGGVTLYEAGRLIETWTGGTPWVAQTFGPDWTFFWDAFVYVFSLLCAVFAIAATRGEERGRVVWTTATLGILLFFQGAGDLIPPLLPGSRGTVLILSYETFNLSSFLAPLGMTYALLNRRLLDVGFALNRAAVFTGVSLVVVGIFVLVEWALSEWFTTASHTENLAIGAALALALGFSVRAIHTRVDRVLDTVFFRKRHEDEQAIRTLAREAAYITDPQILLTRTIAVLEEHADATGVRTLLDDGDGHYGEVSENDPAVVRLRATHRVLDLHDVHSAIVGEFAYPMVARGRLIGALVVGPKRSGESYAPDESQAIEQLAHDAGTALDLLLRKKESGDDVLDEVRASLRELLRRTSGAADLRLEVSE